MIIGGRLLLLMLFVGEGFVVLGRGLVRWAGSGCDGWSAGAEGLNEGFGA